MYFILHPNYLYRTYYLTFWFLIFSFWIERFYCHTMLITFYFFIPLFLLRIFDSSSTFSNISSKLFYSLSPYILNFLFDFHHAIIILDILCYYISWFPEFFWFTISSSEMLRLQLKNDSLHISLWGYHVPKYYFLIYHPFSILCNFIKIMEFFHADIYINIYFCTLD